MLVKYYYVEPTVDIYDLDDSGNMITPNCPKWNGTDDSYYRVEIWQDETHLNYTKRFEDFADAKAYAEEMGCL